MTLLPCTLFDPFLSLALIRMNLCLTVLEHASIHDTFVVLKSTEKKNTLKLQREKYKTSLFFLNEGQILFFFFIT